MNREILAVPIALATALLAGCLSDSTVRTEYASGFSRAGHRVSVFGVFKDGRMNPESWDALSPSLASVFGKNCQAGYGESFVLDHPGLASAIDDVARSQGLGDDLLTQIAPAATGDLILVFTVAGRVEQAWKANLSSESNGHAGPMGGAGRGAAGLGSPGALAGHSHDRGTGTAAFDLSVTMFSPSSHGTVGVVEFEYTGESANEAIKRFVEKIREAIPGSSCEGWNWSVPIDEHRVRDLVER